jgi:non-homologous end joining protein Ku|tara:strand:+ start:1052 stop:1456 length:405 start_codon:yes stop_codon:yes gene_type:complete
MTKHNKYYYETGRNGWNPTSTFEEIEKSNINPKMLLSKDDLDIPKNQTKYKFDWHLDKVSQSIVKLLKEKNEAYGNTALNPANIFSKLDSTEAICARLDDKLSRIKNKGINDKTEDTLDDIIGYLLLLKMSMEK